MHKKKSSGAVAGILLPMGLVCLFAFCSLALALMGGRAYKSIQSGIDDGYGTTVAASYLRTKLSQNNNLGSVQLSQEEGLEVLALSSQRDGTAYITRIYVQDGQLKESYLPEGSAFEPAAGVSIAQVNECTFSLDEETMLFTANLRSSKGVATRVAFALAGGERA